MSRVPYPNFRNYPRFRHGWPIQPEEFQRIDEQARATQNLEVDGLTLETGGGVGMALMSPADQVPGFYARITLQYPASAKYQFQEVLRNDLTTWIDRPDGLFNDVTVEPAVETSGNQSVPADPVTGAIVWMELADSGDHWIFEWQSAGFPGNPIYKIGDTITYQAGSLTSYQSGSFLALAGPTVTVTDNTTFTVNSGKTLKFTGPGTLTLDATALNLSISTLNLDAPVVNITASIWTWDATSVLNINGYLFLGFTWGWDYASESFAADVHDWTPATLKPIQRITCTGADRHLGGIVPADPTKPQVLALTVEGSNNLILDHADGSSTYQFQLPAATAIAVAPLQTVIVSWDPLASAPGKWEVLSYPAPTGAGTGTVTSVGSGTGLTGGPITSTGSLALADTAVTPATYGDATHVGQFTVDQQGRLTFAQNVAISAGASAGSSGDVQRSDGSGGFLGDSTLNYASGLFRVLTGGSTYPYLWVEADSDVGNPNIILKRLAAGGGDINDGDYVGVIQWLWHSGGNGGECDITVRNRNSGDAEMRWTFTTGGVSDAQHYLQSDGRFGLGTQDYGSGTGPLLAMHNCSGAPSSNPSNGGVVYCSSGELYYRGGTGIYQLTPLVSNYPLALFDHYANVSNTGTTETVLYSDGIGSSRLAADGAKILGQYGGTFTGAASATQQLRLYFGPNGTNADTLVFDSGSLAIGVSSPSWDICVTAVREASDKVRVTVSMTTSSAALAADAQYTRVTSLTLTNQQYFTLTGTAAGLGGASNQLTASQGYGQYVPAA